MRKLMICGLCAALLCCTGCGNTASQSNAENKPAESQAESKSAESKQEGSFAVEASEDMDAAYKELLTRYFQAIEDEDFEAYKATMYPPYMEAFAKYTEGQGSNAEESFKNLCHRFDEDGYEGWELTQLVISYYPENKVDLDDFFDAFVRAKIVDEKFVTDCKAEVTEIKDVQFSLYALYTGDAEPVQVVGGNEIMVVKTADGAYLFG